MIAPVERGDAGARLALLIHDELERLLKDRQGEDVP